MSTLCPNSPDTQKSKLLVLHLCSRNQTNEEPKLASVAHHSEQAPGEGLSVTKGKVKTEGGTSPCQARWKEEPRPTKHCWLIQLREGMRVLHVPKASQASEFPADHTEVQVQTGPAGSHKAKDTLYAVGA